MRFSVWDSPLVALLWLLFQSKQIHSFTNLCSLGNWKKSQEGKSGEYAGWETITVSFLANKLGTTTGGWHFHDTKVMNSFTTIPSIFLVLLYTNKAHFKDNICFWSYNFPTRTLDLPRYFIQRNIEKKLWPAQLLGFGFDIKLTYSWFVTRMTFLSKFLLLLFSFSSPWGMILRRFFWSKSRSLKQTGHERYEMVTFSTTSSVVIGRFNITTFFIASSFYLLLPCQVVQEWQQA